MLSRLGRYEVIGELGQGAMGIVYKARDPLIDRIVAIKTINLGLALDEKEEYEHRFYQEARAAGSLSHPNIVTIYDVGQNGDVAYIAMEFLAGRELRDILNQIGILPIDQSLDIVAQVGQGLHYAHQHEIIHRDIKPSNIMVLNDGRVKITDFGIARMASSAVRTQTGMVLGSPKYMSPEQVVGKPLDQRSDVFSLGVMLYEMLTGVAPFNGENVNAIMYQTLNSIPQAPGKLNPSIPEMVDFIVAKALSKKVQDRYQSAQEMVDDLRECLSRYRASQPERKSASESSGPLRPVLVAGTGQEDLDGKEGSILHAGLSKAFDSKAATLRVAALTASPDDVDELSRTLNIPRPALEEILRQEPPETLFRVIEKQGFVPPGGWGLLLIILIVLILTSIVLLLVI